MDQSQWVYFIIGGNKEMEEILRKVAELVIIIVTNLVKRIKKENDDGK